MNNGQAGSRVFTNVDQALAERIISRSKENSERAKAPAVVSAPASAVAVARDADDKSGRDYAKQRAPASVAMWVIPIAAALLVLLMLVFKRKK